MHSPIQNVKDKKLHGRSRSRAAQRRLVKANRGTISPKASPGDVIKMSDRSYVVAKDGSFRTLRTVA